jgi:crotonobetainyl-CoA:carnitine CoA-transferase CaiB-like acyl-CoA transferase
MEQITGMAWVTGFADGPPLIPRGACDPFAGMHAVFALMTALEERDHRGEGVLVEVTMVEAALNAAAEQVVEHSTTGTLLGRHGNRGPVASPQGLYPCAGVEQWLALAVVTDAQWESALAVLDAAARAAGLDRHRDLDAIDELLSARCAGRERDELVEALAARGVPAAPVLAPWEIAQNPQMRARGFFEPVTHPVTGTHEMPGVPFRLASRGAAGWCRAAAPTLGQHNEEILGTALGLGEAELAELRAAGVVGERPLGA